MKVRDLITALKAMPMDAEVAHVWDGEPRTHINVVWLTPDGRVLTADYGELVYGPQNWPGNVDAAALIEDHRSWQTPPAPVELAACRQCRRAPRFREWEQVEGHGDRVQYMAVQCECGMQTRPLLMLAHTTKEASQRVLAGIWNRTPHVR